MPEQRAVRGAPASRPVARRRFAGALAAGVLLLNSCGMAISVEQVSQSQSSLAATDTATALPTDTPSPSPTATETPTPTPVPSPTPDMTATAVAGITQQWSQAVQQVAAINTSLADLGTRFNNGSLSIQQGGGQLQKLDTQAVAVDATVQALPDLPGTDSGTLTRYRQSVDTWSKSIHNLDVAVGHNDIFTAPSLANKLQSIAEDLDQQGTNLHLGS